MHMMANGPSVPGAKGFPGRKDFSAEASKVPGKPAQLVTLIQEY